MEENTNQVTSQTNTVQVATNKSNNKNVLMLLILAALFITFGILIYGIVMNNEADYVSVLKLTNVLNTAKPVGESLPKAQVEGTDSVAVGDIDVDLQDLNNDLQGL